MRLYEIAPPETLTEDMLMEGLLDNIKQTIRDKVKDQIDVVRNTNEALQVIYKIMTDAKRLDTVTFELKRAIKSKLKQIAQVPALKKVHDLVSHYFPQGRAAKDFVVGIILVSVLNTGLVFKDELKDQVVDAIVDKLKDLAGLVAGIGSASALFGVLHALKIGDQLFFKLLTQINKKIDSINVGGVTA